MPAADPAKDWNRRGNSGAGHTREGGEWSPLKKWGRCRYHARTSRHALREGWLQATGINRVKTAVRKGEHVRCTFDQWKRNSFTEQGSGEHAERVIKQSEGSAAEGAGKHIKMLLHHNPFDFNGEERVGSNPHHKNPTLVFVVPKTHLASG